MATTKIQSTHQERIAFVYVRQSTPLQVMENRESTERQYRLRDRAIELGWPRSEYSNERRSPKTGKASAHLRSVEQWPVKITAHHPAYIRWEEFVKNQERLRQNWSHDGNRGVPREGSALLQGIVYCGVCGRKMSVQNRAAKENRFALVCLRARLSRRR
jgi:hypothetical protein